MSGNPSPAKRAYVTINEQRWELVPLDKLSFPETKELKRVSGGMSLTEVEKGVQGVDGDAWFGWLYVSIRRQWPTVSVDELETAIGDTPIVAIIETVAEEASEVADPDPPAAASASDADEQQNGHGSGEKTPQLSTLETAGRRT